ncbi:hypothetical protein AB3S75_027806 [Citrus x aurantiifolia]
MANYDQQQAPAEGSDQGPRVAPPPPIGYPSKDGSASGYPQQNHPVENRSRGDDFWKGCLAALCCCCVLDFCCC